MEPDGYLTARERAWAYRHRGGVREGPRWGLARMPWRAVAAELALLLFVLLLCHLAFPYPAVFWADSDSVAHPGWHWSVAGCAVLAVLMRRWLPSVALLTASAMFAWFPSCAAALAVTAFHASFRSPPVRSLRVVMVFAVAISLGSALILSGLQWRPVLGTFGFGVVVCIVMPGMLATQLQQRDRLVIALRKQTQYLRRSHELADSKARLQERSRIAGEMHDILGHRLSLISLYAGALELDAAHHDAMVGPGGPSSPHPSGGHDEAKLIRSTVADAMEELRRILGILRQENDHSAPVQPADLFGDRADVLDLISQSRTAGIRVDLQWTGGDLDDAEPATRRAVHRIVREGLTNVHRHAAGADARVVVRRSPTRVRVEVANSAPHDTVGAAGRTGHEIGSPGNGIGPRDNGTVASGSGSGLVGVQERVRLLGGVFQARQTTEGGFQLTTDLPLHPVTMPAAGGRPTVDPALDTGSGHGRLGGRWASAATATVLATGLCGIVATVNFAFSSIGYTWPREDETIRPPGDLRFGMDRAMVLEKTGTGDPFIGVAARNVEPVRPPGADCYYQVFGQPVQYEHEGRPPAPPLWPVTRYCFVDRRLVDIASFGVPQPSR